MPHINRIRVNNVKYNFGTQYYDDFLMRFSCKNTIYDLANGGGKSVLMLLLLQNMIPNCTLDDKQPIEKLFRTGEGSTTIHSLIEWNLSDAHVRNNYKYMLTGFCARKAKDAATRELLAMDVDEQGDKNAAAIEYFNYCIFYRKYNDNDIKNLPLEQNGEKVTYTGLKNYLKELEKSDFNLEVHLFERKGDYQRFIADYGIYESEWEIIKGINKTEGHVRTYFETNYKTTRKVVEDLLIEEIIEKSFRNKYAGDENRDALAETLLNIKDKLLELSKKKEEINNYDRQISIIDSFIDRLNSLKQLYTGIDSAFIRLRKLHNTLIAEEKKNKQNREESADQRLALMKDKNELAMKVETARVLVDMEELETLSRELEEKENGLKDYEEKLAALQEQLKIDECGNYYLEYVEYQKEYETLKQVIANMQKDHATILVQIRELVAMKKQQDAKRKAELHLEMEHEQEALSQEQSKLSNMSEENRSADNEMAVWDYRIRTFRNQAQQMDEKLSAAKNNTNLLLAAGAPQALAEVETEIDGIHNRIQELDSEQIGLDEEKVNNRIQLEKLHLQMESHRVELEHWNHVSHTGLSNHDKSKKLAEVYGEQDSIRLTQKVMESYKKTITGCEQQRLLIGQKKKQIDSLKQRKPICENEDVLNVLEYITKYHSKTAVSGADYLAGMEYPVIKEILDIIPFMPFSVVVTDGFEQIIYDGKLAEIIGDNAVVPLIDQKAIEDIVKNSRYSNEIVYLIKNKECYDVEKEAACLSRLELELQQMETSYNRKLENEQIILEDYGFLLESAGQTDVDAETKKENIKKILEQYETEENMIRAGIDESEQKSSILKNEKNELTLRLNNLHIEKENLEYVLTYLGEYNSAMQEVEKAEQERQILLGTYQSTQKHVEALQNKVENRRKRLKLMEEEIQKIQTVWNQDYIRYDENLEEITDIILTPDEVNIKLAALVKILNQENASAADKEKLLGNYADSIRKCKNRIEYLGGDIEYFKTQYEQNSLIQADSEQLSRLKEEQNQVKAVQTEQKSLVEEKRSTRDKLQGKITHAVSLISKKYGYFDADIISKQEVRVFLNENDALLSVIENRIEQENDRLKSLEQESMTLQMLKRDTERLMSRSSLNPSAAAGVMEDSSNLKQECQVITERFDSFIEERFKRSKEFERDLGMLIDTLNSLNSYELALEIKNNIHMPSNAEETEQLIQTFSETNGYIQLEKQRVLQGLEDMQVIKENFENQCIQSCINIKTELERLDKLSGITMGDESIRIINLKIPYVKEEQYKNRMSDYIDHIAQATDSFERTEDKLKYLRNNLCWKKLFSVIVTDMNGIRLNLYKRERIAGQSRYLPYEEAVGSTGQSQGIYIQFLISIINYIASINSRNSDASRLKKAIFIDNPFGAAKDIYIWEPIFKLLKTNNVQLIVPARGATPAITGRFDVNYILGQRMCSGRQQTVVVDYYSNVSGDELEYTTLSYEQTSLF